MARNSLLCNVHLTAIAAIMVGCVAGGNPSENTKTAKPDPAEEQTSTVSFKLKNEDGTCLVATIEITDSEDELVSSLDTDCGDDLKSAVLLPDVYTYDLASGYTCTPGADVVPEDATYESCELVPGDPFAIEAGKVTRVAITVLLHFSDGSTRPAVFGVGEAQFGGTAGSGAGGSAGAAGSAGEAGTAGAAGSSGTTGVAGSAGEAGAAPDETGGNGAGGSGNAGTAGEEPIGGTSAAGASTGGSTNTGGASQTGGTGGSATAGSSNGTAGNPGTAGSSATGGTPSTGGSSATGGSVSATGGSEDTGEAGAAGANGADDEDVYYMTFVMSDAEVPRRVVLRGMIGSIPLWDFGPFSDRCISTSTDPNLLMAVVHDEDAGTLTYTCAFRPLPGDATDIGDDFAGGVDIIIEGRGPLFSCNESDGAQPDGSDREAFWWTFGTITIKKGVHGIPVTPFLARPSISQGCLQGFEF